MAMHRALGINPGTNARVANEAEATAIYSFRRTTVPEFENSLPAVSDKAP